MYVYVCLRTDGTSENWFLLAGVISSETLGVYTPVISNFALSIRRSDMKFIIITIIIIAEYYLWIVII